MGNRFRELSMLLCLAIASGCGDATNRGQCADRSPATQPVFERAAAPSRSFAVRYVATAPELPAGARRVDLWLPVPSSDAQQTIADVHVDSPLFHEMQPEDEYGNRVLHLWTVEPRAVAATLTFNCTRREERALAPGAVNGSSGPAPIPRLLQADRLGIIDDSIRALAGRITTGAPDTLGKARAIYGYVIAHMAYDKTTPGWGNGDTLRACDVGKGNCTDFHALFISLARASGIPARFSIGFQVPSGPSRSEVAGYHCWAEFWLPDVGWVPVDASEAWRSPNRRDFYFGSLDDDRIRLSIGRDIHLAGMKSPPVNYLLSPYAEADGRPLKTARHVTFFNSMQAALEGQE